MLRVPSRYEGLGGAPGSTVVRSDQRWRAFPHELLGITGLNPLNLLLIATLGSYLLQALSDGTIRRFLPAPLLWLYVVPILVAGVNGSRHVGDMVPGFYIYDLINFNDSAGY